MPHNAAERLSNVTISVADSEQHGVQEVHVSTYNCTVMMANVCTYQKTHVKTLLVADGGRRYKMLARVNFPHGARKRLEVIADRGSPAGRGLSRAIVKTHKYWLALHCRRIASRRRCARLIAHRWSLRVPSRGRKWFEHTASCNVPLPHRGRMKMMMMLLMIEKT